MEVYKFNKCLLDRLEESMLVLPWKEELIPASQVREQWSCFIELQIEPAGWQAIWNIPRVICEALKLRYPTAVFGHVEQVLFRELRAVFFVDAVQNENVNVMERHEVALEELWPTINQENNALNVEKTADSIDRLRFFYNHVWMPWDNDTDDEINWTEKHLELRIRLCYDLRKGCINRTLAQHIRSLLTEAKYLHKRREYLELGLSDDEADDSSKLETTQITDLMRLHLRLSMIKNEIEIVENPEMRHIYEQVHFENDEQRTEQLCFVVSQSKNIDIHIEMLKKVKSKIGPDCLVQSTSELLDALNHCKPKDKIFLSPGKHNLKFLEHLSQDGFMAGINDKDDEDKAWIGSSDDDSVFLVFSGNYVLENLVLDCRNVRTGIIVKSGEVILRNCRLIGDGKSSTQQGIICAFQAHIELQNCVLENFVSGIVVHKHAALFLKNSNINNCNIGLESSTQSNVHIEKTIFVNAKVCGIFVDNLELEDVTTKQKTVNEFNDLLSLTSWSGDCKFENCKKNVSVTNQQLILNADDSMTSIGDVNKEEDDWQDCHSPVVKYSKKNLWPVK